MVENLGKNDTSVKDSDFSNFIRNSTPEEAAKVYKKVMDKAIEDQDMVK